MSSTTKTTSTLGEEDSIISKMRMLYVNDPMCEFEFRIGFGGETNMYTFDGDLSPLKGAPISYISINSFRGNLSSLQGAPISNIYTFDKGMDFCGDILNSNVKSKNTKPKRVNKRIISRSINRTKKWRVKSTRLTTVKISPYPNKFKLNKFNRKLVRE